MMPPRFDGFNLCGQLRHWAAHSASPLDRLEVVGAGGAGVRHLPAYRFGLQVGSDAAHSAEGSAFSLQLGSA